MSQRRAKEKAMSSPYKFAPLPSNGSVVAGVTVLVSAWFALAGAAIVNEPVAGLREVPARVTVTAVEPRPEARETIHVVASRSNEPAIRETLHVVASRSEQPAVRETLHVVASRSQDLLPETRETLHVVASRSEALGLPEAAEPIRVIARKVPTEGATAL
jgi:hypothetical protein